MKVYRVPELSEDRIVMLRNEYPRPMMKRDKWWPLNGTWNFAFDDENVGIKQQWFNNPNFPLKIVVPFAFQTKLSGIHDTSFHDYVWYHRKVKISKRDGHLYILHFQAVDYECRIYINGLFIGSHMGGQAPFSFDITEYIENAQLFDLVVYVFDPSTDLHLPRGKQYWKEKSESIWYTRTTGIYQSVWIEEVPDAYIKSFKFTPLYDQGMMEMSFDISRLFEHLQISIYDQETSCNETKVYVENHHVTVSIPIFKRKEDWKKKSWHPNNPYLFDVQLVYGQDVVKTHFGMRKIATSNGQIFLNNQPLYLKMVLDQGYWPDGLLTPPSVEDLRKDIELAMNLGFNGARKHQKCEDSYYAYYADKLGFIVWAEMASSVLFSELSAKRDLNEWQQIIPRDYNHPSIIAWVPLNESWGVPQIRHDKRQQQHALDLYEYIKSQDQTRLVVGNDGWEQVKTDVCAIHHYRHGAKNDVEAQKKYANDLLNKENILASQPADRPIYADGYKHQGEPILLTEFGGISFVIEDQGWGYTSVTNSDDFLNEYRRLIMAIKNSSAIAGYCYTQLSDVEYEVNGLLTYNRQEKVPLEKIKDINDLINK